MMCFRNQLIFLAGFTLVVFVSHLNSQIAEKTIRFSDRDWIVRSSTNKEGPGPNNWDPDNVWIDDQGFVHLKVTYRDGQWYCSELYTKERLGFGHYQFQITGRVDLLDLNVVFGLFNYPTQDVGPDGTNEIDIEFGKFSNPSAEPASYTVYPSKLNSGFSSSHKEFPIKLNGDATTHSFKWQSTSISYSSNHGYVADDSVQQFASWDFQPPNPTEQIPQSPMPIHVNLWLSKGLPPTDGTGVELVLKRFKFTPL